MKHTPGPWEVIPAEIKGEYRIVEVEYQLGELMSSSDNDDNIAKQIEEIDQANARLIAAAPKLLEACEETLSEINIVLERGSFPAWEHEMLSSVIVELEQAISKAQGE